MHRRHFSALFLTASATATRAKAEGKKRSPKPPSGFVPDESTAIKIALAVWEPIYGKSEIAEQAPYRASLKDGVWVVSGSLPVGSLGGTAIAEIAKEDGRVLRVSHGK
jgi:NTF2 fold immunity protein